jgi:hypothetical protein
MLDQTYLQIGKNFAAAKSTLGKTSTVNTAILKIGSIGMFGSESSYLLMIYNVGLTNTQAAEAFGLSTRAIANAKNDESEEKNFTDLSLPKISRDKLEQQRPVLDSYFKQVQPVSGMALS